MFYNIGGYISILLTLTLPTPVLSQVENCAYPCTYNGIAGLIIMILSHVDTTYVHRNINSSLY